MPSSSGKLGERPTLDDMDGSDVEKASQDVPTPKEDEPQFPKGMALFMIMGSVWLAMFLVALDRTILATAVPKITDHFHSLDDVGWYGSSYMLTSCSCQLLFGRIYKFYSTKSVFLICIFVFEVGSALCGAAPSSTAFIVGRAVAGLGAAGIFSGGMMTMFHTVPLHKRPMYAGLFGATFGIASVVGPLLGGVFTDNVSWRWCFYINLPIGGAAFLIILLILKLPKQKETGLTLRQQILQLDPLGTACFLPSIICLILALQWGGTTYPWSSGRIVALLTLFSVLLITFAGIQIWKQDAGTLPPRILLQRSIIAGAFFIFCVASSMMLIIYYLPIWFQAIKGVTAFQSGIRMIPTVLALVLASILSGQATSRIGYYVPAMLITPVIGSIGAGLITTLKADSGHAMWIGYQVLYGFGLGVSMQVAGIAAQAVLPREDVSVGTAIMFFSQQLGGAIFVSVGQNVFINSLVDGLKGVPGLNLTMVVNAGATDIQKSVPAQYLQDVLKAYNHALTRPFVIATGMMAVAIVGSLAMEWTNIKKGKNKAAINQAKGGNVDGIEEKEKDRKPKSNAAGSPDERVGEERRQEGEGVESDKVEENGQNQEEQRKQ